MVALGEAETGFDLEAMRKEDSSWHPCQVSLSSTGVGLMVSFENDESEDIELNNEEALASLRFRSIPLEGDDCSGMKQGDHVLAVDKSKSKSLFYDAELEEVVRVKHSKRVFCRCTFVIKWLDQDLNGETLTVPSSSIMKLATKSINLHPTVDKFLTMIRNSDSPASSTDLEDLNSEIDLNMLIDQHIEKITSAVDVSEEIARDILLGVKADTKGGKQSKRSTSHVKVQGQNHFRRSTRSSRKSVADVEAEDAPAPAPAPAPSIQEKHETMSQLSPLAARAALASLKSAAATFTAMNGTRLSDFLANDELNVKSKLFDSDPVTLLQPQRSTKSDAGVKAQLLEPSSEGLTCSIVEKKSSQTTQTMRVTRSTIKKGAGLAEDTAARGSTNERRSTRSTIGEENVLIREVEPRLKDNSSTSITNPDSPEGHVIAPKGNLSEKSNSVSRKKKPISSSGDSEMNIPSEIGNKRQASDVETSQLTECYVDERVTLTAATIPRRLTRSAVRGGKEVSAIEVGNGLEENLSEKGNKEPSNAVETTPQTKGVGMSSRSQKRKSVSSHKQEQRFSPRLHPRTCS